MRMNEYNKVQNKMALAREFYEKNVSGVTYSLGQKHYALVIPINLIMYTSILFSHHYEGNERKLIFDAKENKEFIVDILSFSKKVKQSFNLSDKIEKGNNFDVEIINFNDEEECTKEELKEAILQVHKISNAFRHSNYDIVEDENGRCVVEIKNREKDGSQLNFSMRVTDFLLSFSRFEQHIEHELYKKDMEEISASINGVDKEGNADSKMLAAKENFVVIHSPIKGVDKKGNVDSKMLDTKEKAEKRVKPGFINIKRPWIIKKEKYHYFSGVLHEFLIQKYTGKGPDIKDIGEEFDDFYYLNCVIHSIQSMLEDKTLPYLYIYLNAVYSLYDTVGKDDKNFYSNLPFVNYYNHFKFYGEQEKSLDNKVAKIIKSIHSQNKHIIKNLGLKGIENYVQGIENNIAYINKEIMNSMRNATMHIRLYRDPDNEEFVRLYDKGNRGEEVYFKCLIEEKDLTFITNKVEECLTMNKERSLLERLEVCKERLVGLVDENDLKAFREYIEEVKKLFPMR